MSKILFIGPSPENLGGVEAFGRVLDNIFSKNISYLSRDDKKEKVYSMKNIKKIPNNLLMKILYRIFSENFFCNYAKKFDVIILNTPKGLSYLSSKNKSKVILVQHQTALKFWKRKPYLNKSKKLLDKMKNEIDLIITLSPYDKKEFIEKFRLDKDKVIFLRHTSNMDMLESKKIKNKNLIMVCRLDNKHKRIDLAIKVMKKLPDFTLNIYGSGPDEKMLKELKEKLSLSNVVFHGSTNKVQEKLDENGIYIMTSDYEGYPISLIEALRRGLPIVLRDTFTSAQDIVQGNGVLLQKEWDEDMFMKAINKVFENYEKYSRKSIELGRRHDFKIIKEEWQNLMKIN